MSRATHRSHIVPVRAGNLHPRGGSSVGLAPIGCRCGSGFTHIGAPAPDSGWQRVWVRVLIHVLQFWVSGAPEIHSKTNGHSMTDALSKPTGCVAVFHPRVWVPVYNPCTTILGPKTRDHPKPTSKPTGT
jgi:hypothetical protein